MIREGSVFSLVKRGRTVERRWDTWKTRILEGAIDRIGYNARTEIGVHRFKVARDVSFVVSLCSKWRGRDGIGYNADLEKASSDWGS